MNLKLFATAAAVFSLSFAPVVAFAQQAVGPVGPGADAANSNSQSGASSTNNNANFNGGNGPITVGPTTVGPQTATSDSTANSGSSSVAVTRSEGGAATSNATGGTSSATTGASTASSTANPNANNAGNAQNITFNSTTPSHTKIESLPQVYAPALSTTLTETCMGSTSGGVSVMGFGGTLGTTWNDSQCVRRLNAREMAQTLGDRAAARALMCQDKDVAAAYAAVGQDCRQKYEVAVVVPPPAPISPVVINVPPAPAPVIQMAPVPNPPEPRVIYRDRPVHHHAAPAAPSCKAEAKVCPGHDD
jgi:hypothetical protein